MLRHMNTPLDYTDYATLERHAGAFVNATPEGLLAISGPTASGKSGLAVRLAKALGAEIISVDSRQVYKGFAALTNKMSEQEMKGVPHHGISVLEPHEKAHALWFQRFADLKINEIQARGNRVILCGGSMLWMDAVLQRYSFPDEGTPTKGTPVPHRHYVVAWPREALYDRINQRTNTLFAQGVAEFEAWEKTTEEGNLNTKDIQMVQHNVRTSIGLDEIIAYRNGLCTKTEAVAKLAQRTRKYAKRQLTWWRGRTDILTVNVWPKE